MLKLGCVVHSKFLVVDKGLVVSAEIVEEKRHVYLVILRKGGLLSLQRSI